jgi:hypothetical protein
MASSDRMRAHVCDGCGSSAGTSVIPPDWIHLIVKQRPAGDIHLRSRGVVVVCSVGCVPQGVDKVVET